MNSNAEHPFAHTRAVHSRQQESQQQRDSTHSWPSTVWHPSMDAGRRVVFRTQFRVRVRLPPPHSTEQGPHCSSHRKYRKKQGDRLRLSPCSWQDCMVVSMGRAAHAGNAGKQHKDKT
jgi:hypothetical protein